MYFIIYLVLTLAIAVASKSHLKRDTVFVLQHAQEHNFLRTSILVLYLNTETYLHVKVQNILFVNELNAFTYLSHKNCAGFLCQNEVIIYHPLKKFTTFNSEIQIHNL